MVSFASGVSVRYFRWEQSFVHVVRQLAGDCAAFHKIVAPRLSGKGPSGRNYAPSPSWRNYGIGGHLPSGHRAISVGDRTEVLGSIVVRCHRIERSSPA